MHQIEIRKLNKTYKSDKIENHVLKDIDLDIEKGEFVAVIGKSGCGKTTFLNILGTLDDFDSGEYLLDGEPVKDMSDKQKARIRSEKIGFVNQDFMLLPNRTAYENVTLPLYFGKSDLGDMKKKAERVLQTVDCYELSKKKIKHCSGGQKQRIAIARALIIDPEIILADEPTGALDSENTAEILKYLRKINKENGVTVIIVTHDPDVAAVCDKTIKIEDGCIIQKIRN